MIKTREVLPLNFWTVKMKVTLLSYESCLVLSEKMPKCIVNIRR